MDLQFRGFVLEMSIQGIVCNPAQPFIACIVGLRFTMSGARNGSGADTAGSGTYLSGGHLVPDDEAGNELF
jgi:hypothetical protein